MTSAMNADTMLQDNCVVSSSVRNVQVLDAAGSKSIIETIEEHFISFINEASGL
jgi:hypothetical protein